MFVSGAFCTGAGAQGRRGAGLGVILMQGELHGYISARRGGGDRIVRTQLSACSRRTGTSSGMKQQQQQQQGVALFATLAETLCVCDFLLEVLHCCCLWAWTPSQCQQCTNNTPGTQACCAAGWRHTHPPYPATTAGPPTTSLLKIPGGVALQS